MARLPSDPIPALAILIRAHNKAVLISFTLGTGLALFLWFWAYYMAYWVLAFTGLVTGRGITTNVLESFTFWFHAVAIALVALETVIRFRDPHPKVRDDKHLLDIAAETVMLLPRLTLDGVITITAWVRLKRADLPQAIDLVHALARREPITLETLPQWIRGHKRRARILAALQYCRIIHLHRSGAVTKVRLASSCPPALLKGATMSQSSAEQVPPPPPSEPARHWGRATFREPPPAG
jgi:hypothetical protein